MTLWRRIFIIFLRFLAFFCCPLLLRRWHKKIEIIKFLHQMWRRVQIMWTDSTSSLQNSSYTSLFGSMSMTHLRSFDSLLILQKKSEPHVGLMECLLEEAVCTSFMGCSCLDCIFKSTTYYAVALMFDDWNSLFSPWLRFRHRTSMQTRGRNVYLFLELLPHGLLLMISQIAIVRRSVPLPPGACLFLLLLFPLFLFLTAIATELS